MRALPAPIRAGGRSRINTLLCLMNGFYLEGCSELLGRRCSSAEVCLQGCFFCNKVLSNKCTACSYTMLWIEAASQRHFQMFKASFCAGFTLASHCCFALHLQQAELSWVVMWGCAWGVAASAAGPFLPPVLQTLLLFSPPSFSFFVCEVSY